MHATRFVGAFHALLIVLIFLMLSCLQGHSAPSLTPLGQEEFAIGDSVHFIQVDDKQRSYLIHVPASYQVGNPTPLVMAFHGGLGTGRRMAKLTDFSALSDRAGFIVVYPDGLKRQWNDGRILAPSDRLKVDDVGFVSALIDHLVQNLTVDPKRVYATGISNGAIFSHLLGCELSHKIAAIGPVAGTIADNVADQCNPPYPISVLSFHGTEDAFVPLNGGPVKGLARGAVLSEAATAAHWAKVDGCEDAVLRDREPDADPTDGTTVRRETYAVCRQGAAVVSYVIEGGGHTWPGGFQYLPERIVGKTSRDINATETIWAFFAGHPKLHEER